MKIAINQNNYKDLPRQIKKHIKQNQKVIINWAASPPRFKDAIYFLQEAADRLILNDKNFEIYNVPLCLMLGYKRYIRFDKSKFKKVSECLKCNYGKECRGIFLNYYGIYGRDEIKSMSRGSFLTDLEKCMIKILEAENNISSDRVLEVAKGFAICAGCSDGNHVLTTGEKLIKRGRVRRSFKKGIYYWRLIK
jgi:hypothetical protein